MTDLTRVIGAALDDLEQAGMWRDRHDQAAALLAALNRFDFTITTTEGENT